MISILYIDLQLFCFVYRISDREPIRFFPGLSRVLGDQLKVDSQMRQRYHLTEVVYSRTCAA